jgi:hypothetical protein
MNKPIDSFTKPLKLGERGPNYWMKFKKYREDLETEKSEFNVTLPPVQHTVLADEVVPKTI